MGLIYIFTYERYILVTDSSYFLKYKGEEDTPYTVKAPHYQWAYKMSIIAVEGNKYVSLRHGDDRHGMQNVVMMQ